ncbi:MAG: hypothetical protein Q8R79_01000, partial [Legionellaceae bacterium]|nr:hypothetical protein [Legionellaceae bacterium]
MTQTLDRAKTTIIITISLVNGVLYFSIPFAGGKNFEKLIQQDNETTQYMMIVVSVFASMVYATFIFNSFGMMSLWVNSRTKAFFSVLAPLS